MKKLEIFDQIVKIMQEDSATKKDLAGADPSLYREKIRSTMSEEEFLYTVRSYLASFGILSHISFHPKDRKGNGFQLRYHEGNLYVLSANSDTNLETGDRIFEIDGTPLDTVYQQHQAYFVSNTPERQFQEWAYFITKAEDVTLERQGKVQRLHVQQSNLSPTTQPFLYKQLSHDTVYLKMENFFDEQAIQQLYQDSKDAISQARQLIIDVRVNHGGSDSLYFPLFSYALPEGKGFKDLPKSDEQTDYGMEILYTDYNVSLRLKQFETYLHQDYVSEETKQMIQDFSEELLKNKDKGYLVYGDDEGDFLPEILGQEKPEQIFILSDVYCASSGDNFVAMMKEMPKVTVVGRPTLGILDYSNCCTLDFGEYTFTFPTSRSLSIDHGKGMTNKGVEPDILIPWSTEHLLHDLDLEECLNLSRQKNTCHLDSKKEGTNNL